MLTKTGFVLLALALAWSCVVFAAVDLPAAGPAVDLARSRRCTLADDRAHVSHTEVGVMFFDFPGVFLPAQPTAR